MLYADIEQGFNLERGTRQNDGATYCRFGRSLPPSPHVPRLSAFPHRFLSCFSYLLSPVSSPETPRCHFFDYKADFRLFDIFFLVPCLQLLYKRSRGLAFACCLLPAARHSLPSRPSSSQLPSLLILVGFSNFIRSNCVKWRLSGQNCVL